MNTAPRSTVFVVDDDDAMRDSLRMLLHASGFHAETFPSAPSFLENYRPGSPGCLILDIRMPGMSGLALQDELDRRRIRIPIIFLSGHGDIPMAVRAVKKGAFDFVEKPFNEHQLLCAVRDAIELESERPLAGRAPDATRRLASLSAREREVLERLLDGKPTRVIAGELSITEKTVEFHRARIREKLGVSSLAELFKLCLPRDSRTHDNR